MAFNITLDNLGLITGVLALILLITAEVISPYYGKSSILLISRRIRYIGIGVGLAFLAIAITKIASIII
jgi:hypothetical protein